MQYTRTGWLALWLLLLGSGGCTWDAEYVVARFEVTPVNWDTLRVAVTFGHLPRFGKPQGAEPEQVEVFAFDGAYDTLYAGQGPLIPIPDARLASREQVLVEVCGTFGRQRVCEQQALTASPKRLHVRPEITYPERGRLEQGRYAFEAEVERQTFGADVWEPIPWTRPVRGHLLAYLDGQREQAIRIPFTRPEGRFDLTRYPAYRDYRYALDTRLLDEEEVVIRFDVWAGLGEEVEPVASVEKHIRPKTRAERTYDVASFAEQAATQILDRLGVEERRRVRAYIDGWEYNKLNRRYRIEVEVQWGGSAFGRGRYRLNGLLEVGEDGQDGRFTVLRSNRRAEHRWEEVLKAPVLALDPMVLEVEDVMETTPEAGAGAAVGR